MREAIAKSFLVIFLLSYGNIAPSSACCGESFSQTIVRIPDFARNEGKAIYEKYVVAEDADIASLLAMGENVCMSLKCALIDSDMALKLLASAKIDKAARLEQQARADSRWTNHANIWIAGMTLLVAIAGIYFSRNHGQRTWPK